MALEILTAASNDVLRKVRIVIVLWEPMQPSANMMLSILSANGRTTGVLLRALPDRCRALQWIIMISMVHGSIQWIHPLASSASRNLVSVDVEPRLECVLVEQIWHGVWLMHGIAQCIAQKTRRCALWQILTTVVM